MLSEYTAGDVIDMFFYTHESGVPTTLAGSPAISIYKDNSTTQTTTGVAAIDVDFDGVTGLNHVRITTTDSFYANGSRFAAIITTGTVAGVSVVGNVVEQFRLTASRAAANQIIFGTVDTGSFTPTTTAFEADDITEATSDHYGGRVVIFTSGSCAGQATDITGYTLSGSNGKFTVTAMTDAPSNNDTFVIV